MTRSELIAELAAANPHLRLGDVGKVVDTIMDGIADALTRGTRVHHRRQHETPRLLQAQHFLIVQRAHRSDLLKVLMERGNTHVHQFGQLLDFHGLREVGA